jgi:hypothetical protein
MTDSSLLQAECLPATPCAEFQRGKFHRFQESYLRSKHTDEYFSLCIRPPAPHGYEKAKKQAVTRRNRLPLVPSFAGEMLSDYRRTDHTTRAGINEGLRSTGPDEDLRRSRA